jgi:acyl-CoA synthetase (AMP-forming)/AMP-acid ligase II
VVPDYGPLVDEPYLGTTVRAFAARPRTLDAVLRSAVQRWPDRPAVEAPSGALTYAELDAAVGAIAGGLQAAGAHPGDRVAVALGHDLPLFALPFACSRLGVTALLLNTTLAVPRWAEQITRAGCRLLVADDEHAPRLAAATAESVVPAAVALPLDGAGPSAGVEPAGQDHPLALIATSGTTGVPKMTTVTSRGLIHAALGYVQLLDLRLGERTLVVLPLYYIGALSAQTTAMPLVGGCCVLPADTRPAGAVDRLAAHGITHLDAVPSWLGVLARDEAATAPLAWRTLIYGGAPMPPETATRLAARFPQVTLFDVWGLSETHGPATAVRWTHDTALPAGTVGRCLAGVEVRALGADGAPLEPGRAGALAVRGANVTPGYLGDPETTAAVLRDGWLHTGDVGRVDADGTVRLLDRAKDVILRGGANVFSVEVEQVLSTAPGVAEAAVYGVPDELGGEAVAAAIVLADGAELDIGALRRLVGEQVGMHAVPRRIREVPALPRNPTGKIDKQRMRNEHR